MATVYKIEIKTVSPYIAYTEKDMDKIMLDLVKSYSKLNFTFESTEVKTTLLDIPQPKPMKVKLIFAWFPVKTSNVGWVWGKFVTLLIHDNGNHEWYLGFKNEWSIKH